MDSLKVDKTENRQIVSKTNVIHFKNVKLQFGSEQIYIVQQILTPTR